MLEFILENSFFLYLSIFTVIMLEYANAPLPSELVLPLSGAFIIPFDLNLTTVIIISIIGGIIGSLINYHLGLKFGKSIVSWMINKLPKSKKSFDVSYSIFNKYKKTSVLFSRLIPIARTVISIVAGTLKMNCFQFILFSTIGITIWNSILIVSGYIFYDNLNLIVSILSTYSLVIKIIGLIILAWICFKYTKKRKKE